MCAAWQLYLWRQPRTFHKYRWKKKKSPIPTTIMDGFVSWYLPVCECWCCTLSACPDYHWSTTKLVVLVQLCFFVFVSVLSVKRVHYLILRWFIFNPPAHLPESLVPNAYAGRFLLTGIKLLTQPITQTKPYQSGDSTRKQTNSNATIQIMLFSDLCTPASVLPVQLGCFYIAQTVWVGAGEQQDVSLGKEHKRLKSSHTSGLHWKKNQYSWPFCWMNGSNLHFK